MSHTPGPWQVSGVRQSSGDYKGHMVGPDGDGVVVVPYNDKDHHECLANARLIAAAPDLLAAAKAVLSWRKQYPMPVNPEFGLLVMAIEKAEGYILASNINS